MIVGGDFNCVLYQKDSTGRFNYSRALDGLVHVFELRDMWQADPPENGYTHYSPMGATRIDRIYTTKELSTKKVGIETVAAGFTDHLAVILRLSVEVPIIRRGRGLWKMNTSLFDEETVKENCNSNGRSGCSR
jgi:endonuclease/exonuclease/phosphatase family metal-dependent hydrolase